MNCKKCSKEFVVTISRQIFCSHKCQAQWAISQSYAKRVNKPKTGSNFICIACGSEYYVPAYRIKLGKSKYCSRSCLAKVHLAQYPEQYGFKKLNKPKHTYKSIKVDGKWVRLHRHIMEQHLGRKLEKWEHVHHINDDPSDNRIDNLQVLSNTDHQRVEHAFRKKIISS
jgi:hypothetical protein